MRSQDALLPKGVAKRTVRTDAQQALGRSKETP
jgi:hypothetical protein